MSILLNILLVIFILVALVMVLVILMQRPKSEGLGAAFGGGVTENIFGAQTTNVLSKITGWLAGIFFLLAFVLSILYARQTNMSSTGLRQELMKTEPGAAALLPTPAPGPAVGAPGSVTNPAPGPAEPGIAPGAPLSPADQAVGITAPGPVAPLEAPAPTAAPQATEQPQP